MTGAQGVTKQNKTERLVVVDGQIRYIDSGEG